MNKRQIERKLAIENVMKILKDDPNRDRDKLILQIMLNFHTTRRTAREYLEVAEIGVDNAK